jgi:C4-dicarboxylate-specific signal transduction histidine kinase
MAAVFDRVQTEQVVFNLVRNAVEATPAKMQRVLKIATA